MKLSPLALGRTLIMKLTLRSETQDFLKSTVPILTDIYPLHLSKADVPDANTTI